MKNLFWLTLLLVVWLGRSTQDRKDTCACVRYVKEKIRITGNNVQKGVISNFMLFILNKAILFGSGTINSLQRIPRTESKFYAFALFGTIDTNVVDRSTRQCKVAREGWVDHLLENFPYPRFCPSQGQYGRRILSLSHGACRMCVCVCVEGENVK